MTGIHFAHPLAFALLAIAPGLAAQFRYGDARRRAALAKFGVRAAPNRKRTFKRALVIAAAILMAVAIAQPLKSTAAQPSGSGDVVFLLDVSRSMLSRDAEPNRLRRAERIAGDIAARIASATGGQRFGLIAFAGSASVLCPLTIDFDYFRDTLRSASPESVARGGTRIGDGLRFALDNGFDDVRRGAKDLILLTDGGDQGSNPQQAAQELARKGIRLTVIGMGDPNRGIEVPVSEGDNRPFLYNGAPVPTRLESAELRAIGGEYWEDNAAFEAAPVVRRIAARSTSADGEISEEYFAPLLVLAAILLALECLISERVTVRTIAAALAIAVCASPIRAQSAADWIRQGDDAFAIRQYKAATTCYRHAAGILPASPHVQFDLAVAAYKAGFYSDAAQAFALAASRAADPKLRAKSLLGEGNAFFRTAFAGDPAEAIRELGRAIELYNSALAADPKLQDAAYNVEIAGKKLLELKRKQRSDAAREYESSSMRRPQTATSDAAEILKDAKQSRAKPQIPRRPVATDW